MGTRTTRIYVAHAEEDYRFYDVLIDQARSAKLAVEFVNMPTKQPWVPRWKGACRERVFQCDGAIVLITKRTHDATGVSTELEFVLDAQIPMLGVRLDQYQGSVPEQVRGAPLIQWNWAGVASFLQSLTSGSPAGRVA